MPAGQVGGKSRYRTFLSTTASSVYVLCPVPYSAKVRRRKGGTSDNYLVGAGGGFLAFAGSTSTVATVQVHHNTGAVAGCASAEARS